MVESTDLPSQTASRIAHRYGCSPERQGTFSRRTRPFALIKPSDKTNAYDVLNGVR